MVSGHFDPFHDGHLSYIKQAREYGDFIVCCVSTDKQLMIKKGKVNIPEKGRLEIMRLIMNGLKYSNITFLNVWDTDTTLIANALKYWQPHILLRGGDKTIDDMPPEERKVCEDMGIKVVHAVFDTDRHGSKMML